jgi:hypothetical protein
MLLLAAMSYAIQTLAPPVSLESRFCWLDPPLVQLVLTYLLMELSPS